MSDGSANGLDPQLLDDFFSEADEHLLGIREGVGRLEDSVGSPRPDTKVVADLFHNIHSFKGISGIVGLLPAEAVAHAMEDFLRLVRDARASVTAEAAETLVTAARKLGDIVAAFRAHKLLPEHEAVLAELKACCESSAGEAPAGVATTAASSASPMVGAVWKFIFSPTQELNARGVNVNSIREELRRTGEILKATPQVKAGGVLTFEFLVAAPAVPTNPAEWEARGVKIEAVEQGSPEIPVNVTSTAETTVHNPFLAPSHLVRVDLKRLDELMRITGELVIHRSRLEVRLNDLSRGGARVDLRGIQEVSGGLGRSLRELRQAIMRVRLVPVAEIFVRMPFVIRDLARETQKKARLEVSGQDTAVDKYLIERLKDPLLHMVRNAFSHGIETAGERVAAGKPAEATIRLGASTSGDSVLIHVGDDGRGIDVEAVIVQARKMGLEVPARMDMAAVLKILCSPGFSTRSAADRAAGRGVGMAVAADTVRELGGQLTLESERGKGTRFTIRLPLTLAIAETFIVQAAGQTCAVPQTFVREILHTTEKDVQIVNQIEVIPYRTGMLPIVRLAGLFGLPTAAKARLCVLVIASERGSVGLLVEAVLGQREVVVRALRDPWIQVPYVSGATELGDGRVVLILDGSALTAGGVRPPEPEEREREAENAVQG